MLEGTVGQAGVVVVVVGEELGHVPLEHFGVAEADSVLGPDLESVPAHGGLLGAGLVLGGEESESSERHLQLGEQGGHLGVVSVFPLGPLLAEVLILLDCLLKLGHIGFCLKYLFCYYILLELNYNHIS